VTQEIRDGQEELGLVSQPGFGVGLAALGQWAIVAGMVGVVMGVTVGAGEERASPSRRAAIEDGLQDLTLAGGHGLAETLPGRLVCIDQELMERRVPSPPPLGLASKPTWAKAAQRSAMKESRRC